MIAAAVAAAVVLTQAPHRVDVQIAGKPFTSLHYAPSQMKPYLHPVVAASGREVTRPLGDVKDHPHHRGIWFAHGDVNGEDFWSEKARIDVESVRVDGATVEMVARWGDLLRERRTMRFGEDRTIDFDITLEALTDVKFGDTKEGTFAIRLADDLREESGGRMVNAGGASGEKDVWGRPSPWVDYSGVAIFDHPGNLRHPTLWHSRAYGLFAANPFGEREFYRDPKRDGSYRLKKGETLRFRYRVVVHEPGVDIAKLYSEYK